MASARVWNFPTAHLTSPKGDLAKKLEKGQIRELYGRERLSQLFHFEILLVNPDAVSHDEFLDAPVTLLWDRATEASGPATVARELGGIVASVRDKMIAGWAYEYVLEIVPLLWKTTLTTTTDVYQELSVPEIVEKIFKEQYSWASGKDYEMRLKGSYPKRDFVVQHEESHFAFISRLCEHVGIFFYFEWKDGHEIAVFADDNGAFQDADPPKAVFMSRGEETHLFDVEVAVRQTPTKYRVRDYDYRTPQLELAADAEFNQGAGGLINEYGGSVATPDEAKRLAQIRAELATAEFLIFEGRSEYPGFRAGSKTTIENHPAPIVSDGPVLLTEVIHHAVQATHGHGEGTEQSYRNTFRAIPHKTPYRPPRQTHKPVVSGLITALIESPQKDGEKYGAIDAEGQYRLSFHNDSRLNVKAAEREPAKASLPVRMAQPSAGADRKLHFPLKHGTEVVVACINGDPDRPVILGAVPDLGARSGKGWRDSPVREDNKEKLILKTNLNELSIDDTEGKPRWRTQVNNAAHVHLLGEPEQEKGVKTQIPEKGHGIASEDNLTATVNKALTFESTTFTAMQQMQTLLTATKTVDYTGEDPGWDDWKQFEQALAKAVEFKRFLEALEVETKKKQAAAAKARTSKAKTEHQQAKKEAVEGLNQERAKEGKGPVDEGGIAGQRQENAAASQQAEGDAKQSCADEKQKEKELQELQQKQQEASAKKKEAKAERDKARTKVERAQRKKNDAKQRSSRSGATPAERSAASSELQAAQGEERQAQQELEAAEARLKQVEPGPSDQDVAAKKRELEAAREKCRAARAKKQIEERKKEHLEKEEKAAKKVEQAEAGEKRVIEFWEAIDSKVEAKKASEVKELEKAPAAAEVEKKDLWSKIAKELADKAHETHLKESKAALDDAKSSLSASTEREAADAGSFEEPYSLRIAKHSAGLLASDNVFVYGDKHATLFSHKNAHVVSGDVASIKAEKGVEIATDDWIKLTATKVVDINSNKDVIVVADSAESKSMPGGHSMLFFSNKGINMESATGSIEGKAMKSIELTASMTGVKITADLANVDIKATAGQLTGMGTAGVSFSTPAMITASAGGMASMSAGGALSLSAGGAATMAAGGAATVVAGAALTLTAGAAATLGAGGLVTIAGTGLLIL